jgi:hypothetical protein
VKQLLKDYQNIFDTSGAIADYVATSLDEVTLESGLKTAAFHWNQWNDGQKKKVRRRFHNRFHNITLITGFPSK